MEKKNNESKYVEISKGVYMRIPDNVKVKKSVRYPKKPVRSIVLSEISIADELRTEAVSKMTDAIQILKFTDMMVNDTTL